MVLRVINVREIIKHPKEHIQLETYITEKRVNKKYRKIFDILKKCELPFKNFEIISDYCKKKKIIFFSTPFDIESVYFLDSINVKIFKIASFDISNHELVNEILKTKKKTIISTGMANFNEIKQVYKKFKKKNIDIAILHCVSSYPNKDETSYLSNITYLKKKNLIVKLEFLIIQIRLKSQFMEIY